MWVTAMSPYQVPKAILGTEVTGAARRWLCLTGIGLHSGLLILIITLVSHKVTSAFSALTLLAEDQEEHPVHKNQVVRCCCRYLSKARCGLFAHGPTNATTIPKSPHLLPHKNWERFYLSGTSLPRPSPQKRPLSGCLSFQPQAAALCPSEQQMVNYYYYY